jgi:pilus assembly protein CpaF
MLTLDPTLIRLVSTAGATDLFLNGHRETWLETRDGVAQIDNPFASEAELADFAINVIAETGRHLDQANPFADVTVAADQIEGLDGVSFSGLRIHAALASACSGKTLVSIRVHGREAFDLADLKKQGMFNDRVEKQLLEIVDRRANFIISGATGAGKTTLLRAMMLEAVDDRILAIEDVAELNLGNEFFLSLQTRQANIEGRGEISLDRLLREALRMRPDRLLVGEVRGLELVTMLQALNTGHSGSATTIHANSHDAVCTRLLGIAAAAGLAPDLIAGQIAEAFEYVIHLSALDGMRKVAQIGRLELQGEQLVVVPLAARGRGRVASVEAA